MPFNFIPNGIILPRQARDKHRESTQKETRFSREPLNRTAEGIAEAAGQMIDYSLSIFLCVARPSFKFS
jgi:hypothetical protein